MKKRVLIIVIALLLLLSTSVSGFHFNSGGLLGNRNFEIKDGIQENEEPQVTQYEKNLAKAGFGLPDLIVTDVKLPDETVIGTQVFDIEFYVKNIGLAPAEGSIPVRVDFDGPGATPKCRKDIFVGGSRTGVADKRMAGDSNDWRYAFIAPGDKMRVVANLGLFGKDKNTISIFGCTRPLNTGEYTITITLNTPGGKTAPGRTGPKGSLHESSYTNNIYVHKMKVSYDYVPKTARLNFVRGLTPFSVPVKTDMTVYQLRESTGCEIYKLKEDWFSHSSRISLDISNLDVAPSSDVLSPETAYFAMCENNLVTVELEGKDPGPFNKPVLRNALTFLPTRNYMASKKLYEFLIQCSNPFSGKTVFKTFTKGQDSVSGGPGSTSKVRMYDLHFNTYIEPGNVYAVYCNSAAGVGTGLWDPASFEELDEEDQPVYTLRGDQQLRISRQSEVMKGLWYFGFFNSALTRAHHYGAPKIMADRTG